MPLIQRRLAGFTLIEVVIVLLLIGIVSALVVANVAPDDKKELRIESERLASLFEQASMDARVSGKAIGWSVDGNGYRFQEKSQDSDWVDMSDDIYRRRQLPDGMKIQSISINQVSLAPEDQLVFSPSGINPPFDIVMAKKQIQMKISGDTMNRVTVEPYDLGQ